MEILKEKMSSMIVFYLKILNIHNPKNNYLKTALLLQFQSLFLSLKILKPNQVCYQANSVSHNLQVILAIKIIK